MLRNPNVLLLCSDAKQAVVLREILSEHAVLTPAGNLSELTALLESSFYDAVFCAWSFHRGNWNDALLEARRLHPDLPVIIFSSTAGEEEWTRVLEAGAFDLLAPPYQKRAVLSALEQATASYEARLLRYK